VVKGAGGRIGAWQDRFRDPSLSVLLVMQLAMMFVAAPLAAKGLPIARPLIETLLLPLVAVVVLSSHRRGAIVLIVPLLAASLAAHLFIPASSPVADSLLRHSGSALTFAVLTWVVSHAVYAPAGSRSAACKVRSSSISTLPSSSPRRSAWFGI
jgi:hypothetical protein